MTRGLMLAALLLGLPACSSLIVQKEAAAPVEGTLAVLPFSTELALRDTDLLRDRITAGMWARGYDVLDNGWVDHVLATHGWLSDPHQFDASAIRDYGAVCDALGADALVLGQDLRQESLQLVLYARRRLAGDLAIVGRDGSEHWRATYRATENEGLVVDSGQIFRAVARTIEHGSSAQWLRLVDEWVSGTLRAVPVEATRPDRQSPSVAAPVLERQPMHAGERFEVTVDGTPGMLLRVEFDENYGAPFVEKSAGRYVARVTWLSEDAPRSVRVIGVDRFGRGVRADLAGDLGAAVVE